MPELTAVTVKRSPSPIPAELEGEASSKRSRHNVELGEDDHVGFNSDNNNDNVPSREVENGHKVDNLECSEQMPDTQGSSEEVAAMITSVKIENCVKQEEVPKPVTPDLDSMSQTRGNLVMTGPQGEERWRAHQMAEDYISLAGELMLPGTHLGPFGYDPAQGKYPIERITAYGVLTSPLRRPSVIEKWSPYEIATFEAALAIFGKNFNTVQKLIRTKSTKDIVEFYYIWKKTHHYRMWKKQYIPPDYDLGESDED